MLWNKRFAFGINKIDEQHEQLFNVMEEIKSLIQETTEGVDCYDEIEAVLLELERYTIYHFETEEELLEEVGFDGLDVHREEHNAFVNKVHDTLDSDIDLQQEGVLTEVYDFLLNWVSEHILTTDVKYVPLLKEKNL